LLLEAGLSQGVFENDPSDNSFDRDLFNGYPPCMRAVLLIACLLLTGCTATQRANIDDAKCQAAGAKYGTRDYVQCRETLGGAPQQ
jgi:hypothetical protein